MDYIPALRTSPLAPLSKRRGQVREEMNAKPGGALAVLERRIAELAKVAEGPAT